VITLDQMTQSLREALLAASAPASSSIAQGEILTADQMQIMIDEGQAAADAAFGGLLGLIAAIQSLRDEFPGLDQFLRQRGIVTRDRAVRK